MVIFKEGIMPKVKTTLDESDECARIADLMVEAMDTPDTEEVVEDTTDESSEEITLTETFRVPGTDEVLEKGTVITISK